MDNEHLFFSTSLQGLGLKWPGGLNDRKRSMDSVLQVIRRHCRLLGHSWFCRNLGGGWIERRGELEIERFIKNCYEDATRGYSGCTLPGFQA